MRGSDPIRSVAVKGRHTSRDDGRRWAPNAKQAALGVAPIAALLLAVGAGGAGLLAGRADLAAAGAVAGAVGVVAEQASSRSSRRRLREDRSQLRAQIRDLDAALARLNRELAGQPSVLRPDLPPAHTTGPLPLVSASDRAAGPVTPRSLPILTANRRGLQSCAPEMPGLLVPAVSAFGAPVFALPGQRPPATPITGLHLPPVENPSLPKLAPGPAAPVLRGSGVPQLDAGPRQAVPAHRVLGPADASEAGEFGEAGGDGLRDDLALIGAALSAERGAPPSRPAAATPADQVASGGQPARGAVVVDLRAVPATAPSTAAMGSASPLEVDDLVYAAIAEAGADDFTLSLEKPSRHTASLFEPVARSGPSGRLDPHAGDVPSGPLWVDDTEMRRLAGTARTASRAMRPTLPPSPYFTPGAFATEPFATEPFATEPGPARRHSA